MDCFASLAMTTENSGNSPLAATPDEPLHYAPRAVLCAMIVGAPRIHFFPMTTQSFMDERL
jgi:hypothetical protein